MAYNKNAFMVLCPICRKLYGLHDDEELSNCFPALIRRGDTVKEWAVEIAGQHKSDCLTFSELADSEEAKLIWKAKAHTASEIEQALRDKL